ncbi:mandelate racemase/muconate lactonizing enzyme family protein [Dysgonomonas sp. Marseille-P4677]|uniref:enolase C-terminal domain-like protein n=1 Tax=Dysgonomonas sp. Marseille-P4677 TaxID=2364790 RepID=UPI001912A86B|nr:mandelate racemase/muconate lactonizing enzyme family protein [Dysgonomonas sp. Marseille-P4677]MBK5722709.1 mandelate racemase/muconate lactonizing enzyme family protein [Dysgonomonas sp. Marseille-P4677]
MKRRNFLKLMAASSASAMIPSTIMSNPLMSDREIDEVKELTYHKLKDIKFAQVQMRYPRLVGKNSRLGVHGTGPRLTFCTLVTDKGAEGLGLIRGNQKQAEETFDRLRGKSVSELFAPSVGTLDEKNYIFDFCLHDLAGIILNKPVYALMGAEKPILTKCYSGMIYFDEMEPENKPSGLNKILENCLFDYNYGYRQLKVKIGRGGKWMSKEAGLKTDIIVTKMIYENFPDCDILVDGNDAFTADYFISYLKGVEDIPLYWIEEPFRETREDYTKLKEWLVNNGRRNTFLADGEANPDLKLALELGKEKLLDIYLEDMLGYGLTPWRKLSPQLKSIGMMASPHAWGDTVKSFYTSHFAAAYGNVPTIEGVTCFSDDIDLSAYKLRRGRLTPPNLPGFGMKLL